MITHIDNQLAIWAITNGGGAGAETGHRHACVLYNLMRENGSALPPIRRLTDVQPDDEVADRMEKAVIVLPTDLRNPVFMRYMWGYTAEEGGCALNISKHTFRSYISNAHYMIHGYFTALAKATISDLADARGGI